MNDIVLAFFLAVIQGITEFLPISSSAHLLLPSLLLGTKDLGLEFLRFIIVNVISLAIVWTVSVSLRNIIFPGFEMDFYPETVSHIIGVASPAIFSFFAHKTYTFNER